MIRLQLGVQACHVGVSEIWMSGSFNVAIPIRLFLPRMQTIYLRLPLPYRVGEDNCPGNTDEKLRTETAPTYGSRNIAPTSQSLFYMALGCQTDQQYVFARAAISGGFRLTYLVYASIRHSVLGKNLVDY